MAEMVLGDVLAGPHSSPGGGLGPRDGTPANGGENAVYICDVTVSPVPDELLPVPLRPEGSSKLGMRVRLVFTRPLEPNEGTEIFETATWQNHSL